MDQLEIAKHIIDLVWDINVNGHDVTESIVEEKFGRNGVWHFQATNLISGKKIFPPILQVN